MIITWCTQGKISRQELRESLQQLAVLAPHIQVVPLNARIRSPIAADCQLCAVCDNCESGGGHLVLGGSLQWGRLPVAFRTSRRTCVGLDTAYFAPLLRREPVLEAVALQFPGQVPASVGLSPLLARAAALIACGVELRELGPTTHLKALQQVFFLELSRHSAHPRR